MLPILKETVELLFSRNLVKVCSKYNRFCTLRHTQSISGLFPFPYLLEPNFDYSLLLLLLPLVLILLFPFLVLIRFLLFILLCNYSPPSHLYITLSSSSPSPHPSFSSPPSHPSSSFSSLSLSHPLLTLTLTLYHSLHHSSLLLSTPPLSHIIHLGPCRHRDLRYGGEHAG